MRHAGRASVLFDLDGVLVDSSSAITSCINLALSAQGLAQRPQEELQRCIGPPLAAVFATLTGSEAESPLVLACIQAYRECYSRDCLCDTVVVPGIPETLDDLADRYRLGVATSKALAFAKPLLRGLDLLRYFEVVAGADLAENEEKAVTIGSALAALKTDRAVMVGDRSLDIVGAKFHGLSTIGVTWGIGSRDELAAASCDAIVDDVAGLSQAIDAVLDRRTLAHAAHGVASSSRRRDP